MGSDSYFVHFIDVPRHIQEKLYLIFRRFDITHIQYGLRGGQLAAQANTLVSALRRDYEAGHASNASLFESTLYSGSFYVELELWYSIRVDEKPTRQPIDTTSSSSGSVYAIVTPEMTCTLEALAGMGIETPATARGF